MRRFLWLLPVLCVLAIAYGGWKLVRYVLGPVAVQTTTAGTPSAAAPAVASTPLAPNAPTTDTSGCVVAPAAQPAPPPPRALNGQLGLWVAVIDPVTLRPIRAVGYQPGGLFPLASTYKQAVLWALLRQVDAGKIDLSTKYDVTPQNQSLGEYPYDHTSAHDLAQRMIHNSDNTATDILHRKVGLQAVQDVADHLGLCHTRLILPTKAWWTAQAGLSPTFNRWRTQWPNLRGPVRLQVAQDIDKDAQAQRYDRLQPKLDYYFDHRYQASDDLRVHNLSTPYEFSVLIAHEFLRPNLSEKSRQIQRKIMRMGYGASALRSFPIAEWGGKGGNGWKILTYTGYLKTKGGEHVVYAFMLHGSRETYTMPLSYSAFGWIRAGLKQVLLAGDGGLSVGESTGRVSALTATGGTP